MNVLILNSQFSILNSQFSIDVDLEFKIICFKKSIKALFKNKNFEILKSENLFISY